MAVKEQVRRGKKFNLFLTEEEHRKVKAKSALKGITMQEYIVSLICNSDKDEDEEWNNLMKSIENAPEEEPDEIDLQIIERAKIEKARGEIEDYDDDLKELDNEGSNN